MGVRPPFDPDKDPLFKSQTNGAPSNRFLAVIGLIFLSLGVVTVVLTMPQQPTTVSMVGAAILGVSLLVLFILCLRMVFAPANDHEPARGRADDPPAP